MKTLNRPDYLSRLQELMRALNGSILDVRLVEEYVADSNQKDSDLSADHHAADLRRTWHTEIVNQLVATGGFTTSEDEDAQTRTLSLRVLGEGV
ncbi:hypothetical protein AVEN_261656-1 [Araneus ventricosus]|uniref:Uncharacterized protein n=1 Tax=Araneus ventricosus TaxID=182803 RepID=A0A4Y2P5J2_ARAVE|nr:hypothetical protein AVEN_261656-1 [Araneus ventricosus]